MSTGTQCSDSAFTANSGPRNGPGSGAQRAGVGMACRVCYHPELEDIERELAEGARYHCIARWYSCDRHSVRYHAEHCMSEKLRMQRFNVQKERLDNQRIWLERRMEKLERQKHEKTQRMICALAEDSIGALSNPHTPHGSKCGRVP